MATVSNSKVIDSPSHSPNWKAIKNILGWLEKSVCLLAPRRPRNSKSTRSKILTDTDQFCSWGFDALSHIVFTLFFRWDVPQEPIIFIRFATNFARFILNPLCYRNSYGTARRHNPIHDHLREKSHKTMHTLKHFRYHFLSSAGVWLQVGWNKTLLILLPWMTLIFSIVEHRTWGCYRFSFACPWFTHAPSLRASLTIYSNRKWTLLAQRSITQTIRPDKSHYRNELRGWMTQTIVPSAVIVKCWKKPRLSLNFSQSLPLLLLTIYNTEN